VGSGHFLVSALNEIIAIKNDLRVLQDHNGKRLKEYHFEVVNDELMVTDEDGIPFSYNPKNKESQRIQETLFHEKQTIIENCLFGVDINPNSVKICRLRLWIELLKNAYYISTDNSRIVPALETLPNIDINIKCGNSLISRFELDADLKIALKQSKWNIESYKLAVSTYRNAESKEQKREMERLIADIKGNFRSEIGTNDPKKLKLEKLKGELFNYTQQVGLFERSKKEQTDWNKKVNTLGNDIKTLDTEIEEIKSNKIYENAFEWRFEFPDVLNDNGDFVGFDAVIGNPPYIAGKYLNESTKDYIKNNYQYNSGKFDVYLTFIEKGRNILNQYKNLCYIIPNTILANENAKLIRKNLLDLKSINKITILDSSVFDEAFVETIIIEIDEINKKENIVLQDKNFDTVRKYEINEILQVTDFRIQSQSNLNHENIITQIYKSSINLGNVIDFCIGIQIGGAGNSKGFKEDFISDFELSKDYKKIIDGKNFKPYEINWNGKFIKYGNWLHRKRDEKFFLNPKIIIRQIGKTPVCAIDFDNYYVLNTIYSGILKVDNLDLKYIFGLINSKLLKFVWEVKFFDGKSLFPKIKKSQLVELPIKETSKENQQPFIDKVNEILSLKSQDPKADTLALEQEIDAMVYELYGLSQEEIKIVEES